MWIIEDEHLGLKFTLESCCWVLLQRPADLRGGGGRKVPPIKGPGSRPSLDPPGKKSRLPILYDIGKMAFK